MSEHPYDPNKLPEIHDQAGDTPRWIPWLGIALLFIALAALAAASSKSAVKETHQSSSSARLRYASATTTINIGNGTHGN
ncbi:MAG: hypothetical protein IPJ88_14325 [Myxococcales bacterium]|nr:MAG: hypothetical protein IPJ88_14325 [Myxococcales bacterium]